jgi:signal transduction histidine kinase
VIVSPVQRLAAATAEVARGRFKAPEDLPYLRRDEIGELSTSFRAMTERLAELDRMKAEFLGVAGHELKTPIGVITSYGELIEDELGGEFTELQAEVLHGMVEQSRVVSRLASRLMDIGRLESGSFRLEVETVHVEDLVTGLARSFDRLAAGKRVRLETKVHPSAPIQLVLDVDLIRNEALGNLVTNAIKFVPEGGSVRVEVSGEGDVVVFRVADDGPGVPEVHRPHVFEKYYQVERSRAMGSGLGLAIVKNVVELHGGTVALLDAPGGAVFEIRLPVTAPSGAEDVDGIAFSAQAHQLRHGPSPTS